MKTLKLFQVAILALVIFSASSQTDGYIKISNGKITVAVDAEVGGRIMEYSLNGNNTLYVKGAEPSKAPGLDGGRCDFGPEKIVPNRPETWSGKWELVDKNENYIKIKSQVAKQAGVYLVREFKLDENSSHLKFTQSIINVTDSPKRYCHWSRTFGEPNGICLAPMNPNSRYPKGYMVYNNDNKLDFNPQGGKNERLRDGILEVLGPPENAKFVTDGSEGWLAYITLDNQLFIKKFEVFENKIYGEMTGATVSIWYNKEGVCEIEPIGPWEWIQPGEGTSFSENWYLMDYKYPKNRNANLNEIKSIIGKL